MPILLNARNALSKVSVDMNRPAARASKKINSFFRNETGATAVEFAIFSPIFIGGILFMGLLAIQTSEYIKIDQIIRAGATIAINDPGDAAVAQRMREVALSKGYNNINNQPGTIPGVLHLTSAKSCFCPDQPYTGISCQNLCWEQSVQRPAAARYFLWGRYRHPKLFSFQQALGRLYPQFWSRLPDVDLRTTVMIR